MPSIAVSWGGIETDGVRRMCHDSNGDFDILADFSSTSASSSTDTITSYHLWSASLQGQSLSGSTTPAIVSVSGEGRGVFEMWAFVSQSNGCGAEHRETVWVGSGDDVPLGPVQLVPDVTRLIHPPRLHYRQRLVGLSIIVRPILWTLAAST